MCPLTFTSLNLRIAYRRFESRAKAGGIAHAPIQLQHGDFLKSSEVKDAVSRAGLVFMNNPVFGAPLNLRVLRE